MPVENYYGHKLNAVFLEYRLVEIEYRVTFKHKQTSRSKRNDVYVISKLVTKVSVFKLHKYVTIRNLIV